MVVSQKISLNKTLTVLICLFKYKDDQPYENI